jgi:hypothetical protein
MFAQILIDELYHIATIRQVSNNQRVARVINKALLTEESPNLFKDTVTGKLYRLINNKFIKL